MSASGLGSVLGLGFRVLIKFQRHLFNSEQNSKQRHLFSAEQNSRPLSIKLSTAPQHCGPSLFFLTLPIRARSPIDATPNRWPIKTQRSNRDMSPSALHFLRFHLLQGTRNGFCPSKLSAESVLPSGRLSLLASLLAWRFPGIFPRPLGGKSLGKAGVEEGCGSCRTHMLPLCRAFSQMLRLLLCSQRLAPLLPQRQTSAFVGTNLVEGPPRPWPNPCPSSGSGGPAEET